MFGIDAVIVGKVLGVAAYAALEYWLGKTDKTKAGSVIEAVINVFKAKVKEEQK